MYIPDHFRMSDADTRAFLANARTGTLVTTDPATHRAMATYLPWVVVGHETLTSHMGAVNPQSGFSGEALVVLMGADAYVSPRWMDPGAAPTWDYETVHLYGELTLHTDPEWIIASWADMLRRHTDLTIDDYDPDYLAKQARAVTGIDIRITEIQAKSKLSQNRSESEVRSIADHLEPTCPVLADRLRDVSLPHIAAREERVRAAVAYRLPE